MIIFPTKFGLNLLQLYTVHLLSNIVLNKLFENNITQPSNK